MGFRLIHPTTLYCALIYLISEDLMYQFSVLDLVMDIFLDETRKEERVGFGSRENLCACRHKMSR